MDRGYQYLGIFNENTTRNYDYLWGGYQNKILEGQVARTIERSKVKRDSGPMGLSLEFIKYHSVTITPILTRLFNVVVRMGRIPESWKLAYLIPIPKNGTKVDVRNYRGIAIQTSIPKIFDSILNETLRRYLNDVIPDEQHGFRAGRNTESNLLDTTHYIHENIGGRQRVDVIYLDYAKAFDRVDHGILAAKLAKFGTPFLLYLTIMSFVSRRKYVLKVDRKVQDAMFTVNTSVPQGSVTGPTLFLLVTADMSESVKMTGAKIIMFADDTKLCRRVSNIHERN